MYGASESNASCDRGTCGSSMDIAVYRCCILHPSNKDVYTIVCTTPYNCVYDAYVHVGLL